MTAKTRPTITTSTKARAKAAASPLPPALTSTHVAHMARWELREAIDGYLSAKERHANAQTALAALDPKADAAEIATIKALGERAHMTLGLARIAIAETLLLAWGIATNYEQAQEGATPWEPLGAYVDMEHVAWIKPGELDGKPNRNPMFAEVTVVALEDLPLDSDEDRLLAAPPCPLLRLHYREPARVIPAGAPG